MSLAPAAGRGTAATPDDWRVLRAVALYRLLLLCALLALQETGYAQRLFTLERPDWFHAVCVADALLALVLLAGVIRRWPPPAALVPVSLALDIVAIAALTYAAGGIGSGLGMLLILPVVGYALLSAPRIALAQAAVASAAMFAEELWHGGGAIGGGEATETGILGLILFGTSLGASFIGSRAHRSEALAARVGSDLARLAQLNERILETMETGVLVVVDAEGTIGTANAAARSLLRRSGRLEGTLLGEVAPGLAAALAHWRADPGAPIAPLRANRYGPELLPRFMRLGYTEQSPTLLLLDPADRLREQAQQIKLAALGRLSAGIAHEIRNPLSAIRHAGQLLSESPALVAEDRRLLEMIERQSRRLDRIVADVLGLSRRDAAQPERIALGPWLAREIGLYCEGRGDRRLHLVLLDVPPGLSIRFDPHHLQQVLHNLWNNSLEHGARDGRTVTVTLTAGRLSVTGNAFLDVADDGPGIAPEVEEKIFEPFFTTAHDGTGLGLYLARELCDYNRARLIFRRREQGGACFRLLFAAG